ncbi:MAG: TraR/DksA C4-type zinc finger protein, partial [Victivallaceae bacterium]|nr:TraR/DksA C4-type zinc finger protein [Victivallaceae bacterium]
AGCLTNVLCQSAKRVLTIEIDEKLIPVLETVLVPYKNVKLIEGDVLKLINDALKRLIDGEYGKCQDCGEAIPEGRLQIRPYAVYCVKCKSRHESEMSR